MTTPQLAADSITLSLGGRSILRAAYVDALAGRITALVGRSGAGKTTLFEVIVGRRRGAAGHVRWNGEIVKRPSLPRLARRGLFYHPDHPWLAPHLSAADHFALLARRDAWRDVADALGVMAWIDRDVGRLSGGELRLTELAIGIALRPTVALLDEPFRGLEPRHREDVATALRLLADQGSAVLFADHDVERVRQVTDRLFSLEEGTSRMVDGFRERPVWEWYHEWAEHR
ncbi:MAG: ATP-binding cassette domain-containing protein [Gemmatimonadales bacterium]